MAGRRGRALTPGGGTQRSRSSIRCSPICDGQSLAASIPARALLPRAPHLRGTKPPRKERAPRKRPFYAGGFSYGVWHRESLTRAIERRARQTVSLFLHRGRDSKRWKAGRVSVCIWGLAGNRTFGSYAPTGGLAPQAVVGSVPIPDIPALDARLDTSDDRADRYLAAPPTLIMRPAIDGWTLRGIQPFRTVQPDGHSISGAWEAAGGV